MPIQSKDEEIKDLRRRERRAQRALAELTRLFRRMTPLLCEARLLLTRNEKGHHVWILSPSKRSLRSAVRHVRDSARQTSINAQWALENDTDLRIRRRKR